MLIELGDGGKAEYRNSISYVNQPHNTQTIEDYHRQRIAAEGRKAWAMLHNYLGCDPQWVELWEHFIPNSGGCGCTENYKSILKDHPLDYSSPDAFFVSGVVLHNAVNRKLGKAEMGLDEARGRWGRPAPT